LRRYENAIPSPGASASKSTHRTPESSRAALARGRTTRKTVPVEPPAAVREFVSTLVDELVDETEVRGVYVHGSAVLGDWRESVSDIDLLVVVSDPSPSTIEYLAATLGAWRDCPGVGLEASVVEDHAAQSASWPWPFLVHVTTAARDRKTVWGGDRRGDPDLVLHYLVTRHAGWTGYGVPARAAIGRVADTAVFAQLARELRWAVAHASETYAVLNACRALRYSNDHVVSSKTAAGRWAVAHDIEPELVRRALDQRRSGIVTPVSNVAAAFLGATAERLSPGA
jgi:streptomycin 3"-adenylyltransferase